MKRILLLSLSVFVIVNLNAQNRLVADTSGTKLQWKGEKVLGEHHGTIRLKSGWITMQDKKISSGEFLINMATIKDSEDNSRLEGHLKSDDFFNVEKFPVSRLVITESTPFDKGTGTVKGNLTIRDVTDPVEFRATMQKKDDGLWFFTKIIIDRSKYNIKYGSGTFFDNLGDKTIYDDFELKISLLLD